MALQTQWSTHIANLIAEKGRTHHTLSFSPEGTNGPDLMSLSGPSLTPVFQWSKSFGQVKMSILTKIEGIPPRFVEIVYCLIN